jgi:hypothetical protein
MGGIDEDWRWFLVLDPQIGYCKCGACSVARGSTPKDLADAMRKMGDAKPQDGLNMWET